jgi:transcriptional regulator GlxA family with amidase domain
MPIERLIAADALERIRSASENGARILGVDGFRVVPEGFIAALDLVLDLSVRSMSIEAAATAAEQFITSRAADDVLFEVVMEGVPNDS